MLDYSSVVKCRSETLNSYSGLCALKVPKLPDTDKSVTVFTSKNLKFERYPHD